MGKTRIGVFVNEKRDNQFKVTKRVVENIKKYGMEPVFPVADTAFSSVTGGFEEKPFPGDIQIAVSLGGDGTLLNTARLLFHYGIPVIGINLGTVGFLAEVEIHDIENAIRRIANHDYTLKNRMVLEANVIRNGNSVFNGIALNDVVVSRGGLSRIIRLKIFMDNQFIDSFPGDGVIISTPSGSTAYTLSAGGPIVQPEMQMMITTPICPHILYSRSFITSPDRELSIQINHDYPDSAIITLDGQEGFDIMAGDRICVRKTNKEIQFVSMDNINFYDVLRAKIHNTNS